MNGVIALLAFTAGCMLKSNENGIGSLLNEGNIKKAVKSFLLGSAISIPFAIINVAYFVVAEGPLKLQNPFVAAFFSLEPGISEEIIFRFFIINAASAILRNKLSQKSLIFVVVFLAVVPHSIIHYPDLWIKSLPNAIFLFFSTSLLFGFPMAYIQYKKNLESAIGFHWFIDFLRFFAGF
ncbi:MAG TPA: CPBP family glutamic-type intramembrane protease [Clostridia bacterium]